MDEHPAHSASPPTEAARADSVRGLARARSAERGPLLEILLDVQREHGYVDPSDVPVLAEVLNLSVADVHGVLSFYHDLRTTPPPRTTVALCRAEACQSVGAEEVYAQTRARLAGRDDVELREVFCFGNCALGPSGTVAGRLHGRLDADRVDALVDQDRRDSASVGSAEGRS